MGLSLRRILPAVCIAFLTGAQTLTGQQDFRQDLGFFRNKLPEFNIWLQQNQLGHIFRADSVAVSAN